MLCLEASSETAAAGSESDVESIFTMMSLEDECTGADARSFVDLGTSLTAAMTVVLGRAT